MYTKKNLLHILDTKVASAFENMELDAKLLSELSPNETPILHLYDWARPSITYGYFIDPKKYLRLDKLATFKIDFARRPTGGGIVFHLWDLAFSFLMPASHPCCFKNTLENYEFVNSAVKKVASSLEQGMEMILQDSIALDADCTKFCMARPTVYDVVVNGRKVAGAAQRRTKNGYLHQGTISLQMPDINLLKEVLLSDLVVQAMQSNSFAPKSPIDKEVVKNLLANELEKALSF